MKSRRARAVPPRPATDVAGVRFQDHAGTELTFADAFHGHPSIVVFFYTRCDNPTKCPLTMYRFGSLQRLLQQSGLGDAIGMAAITYDPEYDRAERLLQYAQSWGAKPSAAHRILRTVGDFRDGERVLLPRRELQRVGHREPAPARGVRPGPARPNRSRRHPSPLERSAADAARIGVTADVGRMKTFAAAALLVLVVLTAPAGRAAAAPPQPARPPNIVWISNEDMSPHLGVYGDALARTPTLDRFAATGDPLHARVLTAPVCAPSRAAIITGMYQAAIGAQHMRTTEDGVPELPGPYLAVPPFYVKAFPEYLRAAGYFTSNRAKTDYQFGVPFTIWDDLGRNAHWRNRPDKSQPFFSVFNLEVTHESQSFPTSPARKGKPPVTRAADVRVPPYYPDTPAVRDELARMYDNIQDMDAQVAEILRQLEEDGLADNTIVFYWSDHGDGVPRAKRSLYDSGLRVPLMIRVPPRVRRRRCSWLGARRPRQPRRSGADGARAGGLEPPTHMQGRVLIGPRTGAGARLCVRRARSHGCRIRHDALGARRAVSSTSAISRRSCRTPATSSIATRARSCRSGCRLQAEGALTGPAALWMRTQRPAEELYDVRRDPHQIDNLASAPAHRPALERMREAVSAWMTRIGDQGLINEAEMIQRMWPGGVQPVTATPYIVPRRATARTERQDTIALSGPMEVVIYVPTQGASIGYTTDAGRGCEMAALYRSHPRSRTDDAAREGHSLWLQGERRGPGCVHAVACSARSV